MVVQLNVMVAGMSVIHSTRFIAREVGMVVAAAMVV